MIQLVEDQIEEDSLNTNSHCTDRRQQTVMDTLVEFCQSGWPLFFGCLNMLNRHLTGLTVVGWLSAMFCICW